MRNILILLFSLSITLLNAQTVDDFGKIALKSDISSAVQLSQETKSLLETKLNQIVSNNGMAATDINPRFVITAKINVISKDIVPGPPQMISQKLEITFFVGDAAEQKLYGNTTVPVTGTGINETKSYLDAIRKINTGHAEIKKMLEESKQKIVAYYRQNCESIMEKAKTLSSQGKYGQAIYDLALIPDVCSDCYSKSLKLQGEIFSKKIETEGQKTFAQAQTLWAQSPNKEGAGEVMRLVAQIHPNVSFISKVQSFVKDVTATTEKQELREWEQQVKEYNDSVKLREMRIKAFREIAVEYAKNQPKTVYRYSFW